MNAPLSPRHRYVTPELPDVATRTHTAVTDQPSNLAAKLGGLLAPVHWLNAYLVGHGLPHNTPTGGKP